MKLKVNSNSKEKVCDEMAPCRELCIDIQPHASLLQVYITKGHEENMYHADNFREIHADVEMTTSVATASVPASWKGEASVEDGLLPLILYMISHLSVLIKMLK